MTNIQQKNLREIEKKFRENLKDQYLRGLATGGKTYIGLIYQTIIEGEEKGVNADVLLRKVKVQCEQHLGVLKNKATESLDFTLFK